MTSDLFGHAPGAPVKALTLHQPWASLMAWGVKTIETRSWPTAYRGPLAIHAAKTIPDYARAAAVEIAPIARALASAGVDPTTLAGLPLGAVVALVDLIDCRHIDETSCEPGPDRPFGNFASGRFGWVTRNPRVLAPPVPARGRQGLWDWAPPAELGFAEARP